MINPSFFNPALFAQAQGLQAITDAEGVSIAITGMLIVFCALTFITLFIGGLPLLLAKLDPYLPEIHGPHAPPTTAERLPADEERVVAAIGYVLHQRRAAK